MSVLSKPMFFKSRFYGCTDQFHQKKECLHNSHFWIEKGGRIIDPTRSRPFPDPKARTIYIPFDEETQRQLGVRWMVSHLKRNRHITKEQFITQLDQWLLPFPKGEHGKCYYNAMNYQLNHGGKLVCGLLGHYMPSKRIVDIDYGY